MGSIPSRIYLEVELMAILHFSFIFGKPTLLSTLAAPFYIQQCTCVLNPPHPHPHSCFDNDHPNACELVSHCDILVVVFLFVVFFFKINGMYTNPHFKTAAAPLLNLLGHVFKISPTPGFCLNCFSSYGIQVVPLDKSHLPAGFCLTDHSDGPQVNTGANLGQNNPFLGLQRPIHVWTQITPS